MITTSTTKIVLITVYKHTVLWGAVAQWSEHLQLKQEALSLIPGGYPGFFSSSWLTNVDEMKDLSCSSGALVQFGCYQHGQE